MTYELIGKPQIQSEYSDEYETAMICDLRRSDGETGDVWIVAGVPEHLQSAAKTTGTQRGYERVRVFGDSPDCWCPASFDYCDSEAIVGACRDAAIEAHRGRM